MSLDNLLIVGLGNPGAKYNDTRHNVGFLVVDALAERWGMPLGSEKWQGLFCREKRWGINLILLKPQTFMNRSGQSVAPLVTFYKIPSSSIIVVHDDLDMAPGRLKLVKGGGAGGHNGIRSLVQSLGTSDFYRLKIGIGRPGQGEVHPDVPVTSYVLGTMDAVQRDLLVERQAAIDEGLDFFVEKGPARAMSFLNSIK